jgi:hypothetical protein
MQFDIQPFDSVDAAKEWAVGEIDAAAGIARSAYLTSITGQDAIYSAKLTEAKRYAAAGYPDALDDYHWIREESAATGISPKDTADTIITSGSRWNENVGPTIEGLRIGGKLALNTMTSIQEVLRHVFDISNKLKTV